LKSPQYREEESKQDSKDGWAEIEQEEESFMKLEQFGRAEAPCGVEEERKRLVCGVQTKSAENVG
jgi:hypothetical protein